jgi:RNA polymerase sigma-70 factor (ECF subfamily)
LQQARDEILEHIPALRTYALSLTRNPTSADDLVQDALIKGWRNLDRFAPGTNMRAWLFTILRNTFYSDMRKANREVGYDDMPVGSEPFVRPDHDGRLAMDEFRVAFAKLPDDQREALTLITVVGMTYEEAANTCGAAVGTVKSRVNRGRAQLAKMLALGD